MLPLFFHICPVVIRLLSSVFNRMLSFSSNFSMRVKRLPHVDSSTSRNFIRFSFIFGGVFHYNVSNYDLIFFLPFWSWCL